MKKSATVSEKLFDTKDAEMNSWRDFVESTQFEMAIGVLIMLNAIVMAFEVQWQGLKLGHTIQYAYYTESDPWPRAKIAFDCLGLVFGIIFTMELLLKVSVFRCGFFASGWNVLDLMIVAGWLVEVTPFLSTGAINPTVLRAARLARLLRLVRVVRQIRTFDSLFLMCTAIVSSTTILVWACVLLFVLQVLTALCFNQVLHMLYFGNDDIPQSEQQKVFEYFGSFSRSMLSTWEMTLANWPPVCRALLENVSEWFIVIAILHKLTVGFAVIGVINGVFIQETFRAAASDDFIMMHAKEKQMKLHAAKMEKLFAAGDESGDGELDREEFLQLIGNEEVKVWLASMELDPSDGDALFTLMAKKDQTGDQTVTAGDLVQGVSRLKGAARSLDMLKCMTAQEHLSRLVSRLVSESESDGRGAGQDDHTHAPLVPGSDG